MNLTTQNVENALAKLESIDAQDEYAYERALLAFATIKNLPILIYEILPQQMLCRTRTHDTPDFFVDTKEIGLPPLSVIKSFARCNKPYQQRFYCSENRPTSFAELIEYWAKEKSIGDKVYVTVGRWVTKKPLYCVIITSPQEDKRVSNYDKEQGKALDNFLSQYDGEIRQAMIRFYDYMFDKFRKQAKDDYKIYIITTAYSNLAFLHARNDPKVKIDCIHYPSVPFEGQGVNFAIEKEYITPDNLELTHVICNELTITKIENGLHTFTETNNWSASHIDEQQGLIIW